MEIMKRLVTAVLFLCIFSVAGRPIGAEQQQKTVTLDIMAMPIKKALDILFANSGWNYSIDAAIGERVLSGSVTIKDIPFNSALKAVLRRVGLSYELKDGCYFIVQSHTSNSNTPSPQKDISSQSILLPSITAQQNDITVPVGTRLVISGNIDNSQNTPQLSAMQLCINNKIAATESKVGLDGGYALDFSPREVGDSTFRVIGVLSNNMQFVSRKGVISVYDKKAPFSVSKIASLGIGTATLQIEGTLQKDSIKLHLTPKGGSDTQYTATATKSNEANQYEVNLSNIPIAEYTAWPLANDNTQLIIGAPFTLITPDYLSIVDPSPDESWQISDPKSASIEVATKNLGNAKVSVIVDGATVGAKECGDSDSRIKISIASLHSGQHRLSVSASANGRVVSTFPIMIRVINPGQDAIDAQAASLRAQKDQQAKAEKESSRLEAEVKHNFDLMAVQDKFYKLPRSQQNSIRRQYESAITERMMNMPNGNYVGESLWEYLLSNPVILK